MMKKLSKFKKVMATLVACATALTAVCATGCGGKSSTITTILIKNLDGGIGSEWLYKATEKFAEMHKDTSFEAGKTGVKFEIQKSISLGTATMNTDGTHIFFDEASSDIFNLSQKGYLLDITDIVTEKSETRDGQAISIEDKISEEYRSTVKGNDGKYYGLPHYEAFGGMSYNISLFDEENLYFAAPEESNKGLYKSPYGEFYFVKNQNAKKSCGADGIYGTEDDGLPSSLQELIVLCAYMKNKSITPIGLTGQFPYYSNYLHLGLWASLAGYEEMRACYDFTGDVEVITGWEDTYLFNTGVIHKPITKVVKLNGENGYLAYDSVARYYAGAFIEMIKDNNWLTASTTNGNTTHLAAQEEFVFGGYNGAEKVGMFIDGSYWYNEAKIHSTLEEYEDAHDGQEFETAFMPLPTTVSGSVKEGEGKEHTMLECAISFAMINGNIKNDAGMVKACKEFIKFLYSDAQLEEFTVMTGEGRTAMNYPISEEGKEEMPTFYKTLWNTRETGKVVYCGADNSTFIKHKADFQIRLGCRAFNCNYAGVQTMSFYQALSNEKATAKDLWEFARITEGQWTANFYEGNK